MGEWSLGKGQGVEEGRGGVWERGEGRGDGEGKEAEWGGGMGGSEKREGSGRETEMKEGGRRKKGGRKRGVFIAYVDDDRNMIRKRKKSIK